MADPLTVSLPRFEGPLDLLLSLVRKHEVAITEIPIAEITRQYLDYLHQAEELNIDLGGEFAFMAATLIWIKARSLAPRHPASGDPEPDPRQELIDQLLDYEAVRKKAVEFLAERLEENSNTWSHTAELHAAEGIADSPAVPASTLNVFDVIRLAERVLEIAQAHSSLDVLPEQVTIEDMLRWLERRLKETQPGELVDSTPLLNEQPAANQRLILFLALLELARIGKLQLRQEIPLGSLWVTRTPGS